ncbi:hypothetical protein HA44_01935 [Mixta gaviniae]|nr:hypothetical protein HA44_01935 [Mixta gaviniae]
MRGNNFHRLADSGAGGDHIIHQHHASFQRATDQQTAFAMILRLFTVKAVRYIALVMVGERDGGRGGDRNAFIGRAEQQIEVNAGINQRLRVKAAQQRQIASGVEQARIKEIGLLRPDFRVNSPNFSTCLFKANSIKSRCQAFIFALLKNQI